VLARNPAAQIKRPGVERTEAKHLDVEAVGKVLGHSSIAITGDMYGHTSDDTARAAVDGLAGRLGL
jgi:integrase